HWHIELQPLIETWGGCEKGSGVHIVTVKPEDAANKLRKNLKRIPYSLKPSSTSACSNTHYK
ncbi:MAG: hypothetical protein DRO23_06210, partial [Thermoprotei archaeon]